MMQFPLHKVMHAHGVWCHHTFSEMLERGEREEQRMLERGEREEKRMLERGEGEESMSAVEIWTQ